MSDLKKTIKDFADDFLLDQYLHNRDEYTQEALTMMEEEIAARKLSIQNAQDAAANRQPVIDLATEEFVPFDHGFYQTDLLLAQAVLRDEKIPFIVDSTNSSDVLPLESETMQCFTIHVPQSLHEKAHALIDEHFIKSEGFYTVKYSGVKDRLKLLTFTEIPLSQKQLSEEVEVQFTDQEIAALTRYTQKLLAEADTVEQQMDRMVFYYDNLEESLQHLKEKGREQFSRMDLLTLLEVLQIYCDAPDFPPLLEGTAEALLTFFNV
jgi:hypothetical protein